MTEEPNPLPSEIKKFKCQGCGADLAFDPEAGKQKCSHCGYEHDVPRSEDDVKELDFRETLKQAAGGEATEERQTVRCNDCGAESTLDPNVTSDECPFCGSPVVIDRKSSRKAIKPRSLLPIKVTREEAGASFRKWLAGLWFAPNKLKAYARRGQPINGLYIPYWTYDCRTTSFYRGQRGVDYWVSQSYTDSQGRRRTRRVRRTRWYTVSGVVYNSFDDLLVLASNSLPRKYTEQLEPWDLENLTDFNERFLSGYRTESYQIGLEEGFERAREIMDDPIRSSIRLDIGGDHQRIDSVSTQYKDITFKHILLPIWISAYKFKGKAYRFLVNGRTGEVQGERPWSWVKISLLVLVILAVVGGIIYFATK